MALWTATLAGNWSNAATWGGGGVPGTGDTVQVNAPVVLDIDADLGTSGASGTVAVAVSEPGRLTWQAGRTLRCRGDVIVAGTHGDPLARVGLELAAGSVLEFVCPVGAPYVLLLGAGHFHCPLFRVRGTSGSPAILRSDVSGGRPPAACGDPGNINQGSVDAEWLQVTDFGDAARPAWKPYMGNNDHNYCRFAHCLFTRAGEIGFAAGMSGGATFVLDHCRFVAGLNPTTLSLSADSERTGGGRELTSCAFDGYVKLYPGRDFSVHHCLFAANFVATARAWAAFHHNVIVGDGFPITADASDLYHLNTDPGGNPHGIGVVNGIDADITLAGIVIEAISGGAGDFIFPQTTTTGKTFTVTGGILLPLEAAVPPGSPGKWLSVVSGPSATAHVEHCTIVVSDAEETGNWIGETYSGHAGMIGALRSNLIWRPTTGTWGYKFTRWQVDLVDAFDPADADYNWGWNLAAGSAGKGYHATNTSTPLVSAGAPGAHDGEGDPGFVDRARNLAKWAVDACGSTGATEADRRADALAALATDLARIDELLDYVREGFRPTNPAMATAAHDGTTPGAVAFGATTPPPADGTRILLRRNGIPGAVPAPETLQPGELALCTADGNLYTKLTDESVVIIGRTGSYLQSGLVKNETVTGILAIATPDEDYLAPDGSGAALTDVVHTAGAETIAGPKTFTDNLALFRGGTFGNGTGILNVGEAQAPPSAPPNVDGGLLYNVVGNLRWQSGRLTIPQSFAGVFFTQISWVQVTGTVTSRLVGSGFTHGSTVLPANFLTRGKGIRIRMRGNYDTDATAGWGNWQVNLGGVSLGLASIVLPANARGWKWAMDFDLLASSDLGTGAQVANGGTLVLATTTHPATTVTTLFNGSSTPVNTTVASSLDVWFTFGTAGAMNRMGCLQCTYEILPSPG